MPPAARRSRRRRDCSAGFLWLLLALAAGGCDSPSEVEPLEQALFVQAYLHPGADARVRLRQTIPPDRFYEGLEDTVRDAEVIVEREGEQFVLAEDSAMRGDYVIPTAVMPVEEGATYRLTVRHEGRLLTASTTVPIRARVTAVSADTITYLQSFADYFGELVHPGEFSWTASPDAAGYVILIEAAEVTSLPISAEPLTSDLDSLIAQRQRLEGQVRDDSLAVLDRRIDMLRTYFRDALSLRRDDDTPVRWLRDRQQQEWDEIDTKDWTEGRKWRERRRRLGASRVIEHWMPPDTLRSDFWWVGVRFEGEYRVHLQSVDENYFDYYTTAFNGQSGADGDKGPVFHVQGGLGVFGSYSAETFTVVALRGEDGRGLRLWRRQEE